MSAGQRRACFFKRTLGHSLSRFSIQRIKLPIQTDVYAAGCLYQRYLHTSGRCNAAPLFWALFKPLAKVSAILWGRGFRKWWQALPVKKRQFFLGVMNKNKYRLAAGSIACGGFGMIYYLSHLEEAPVTHRKRFIAFTPKQFQKIVDVEYQMTVEQLGSKFLPKTHPYYARVLRVARRLHDSNQDIHLINSIKTWSVTVVDDSSTNAFVMPNGQIFVFSGMLQTVTNDDQLGIVLGHEMAHAILSHGAELVSFAQLVDVVIIFGMAAIWMFLPSDSIALVTQWFLHKVAEVMLEMPYNRKLETEADEVGLQLAGKACFDVRESTVFWDTMSIRQELKGEKDIAWLSTHPANESRSENLDKLVPNAEKLRDKCKCPPLPKKDPRQEMQRLRKTLEKSESLTSGRNVVVPVRITQPPAAAALKS